MATTYTWNFHAIDRTNLGVVTKAMGDLVGTDGAETALAPFAVNLGPIDPNNFVPFDELTPEILGSWTTAELGGDRVRTMKAMIEAQLAAKIAPTTLTVIPPWVTAPTSQEGSSGPMETP